MSTLPAEILVIEGPDAIAFAHAQLSSDVRQLAVGAWQWSAWLNPQGRVRALLQVMRPQVDCLHLLLRGGRADTLATALTPYVMRSKLTLQARAPSELDDASAQPLGSVQHVDGTIILGMGSYAMRITRTGADTTQAWREQAIHAGHPWLPDSTLDTLLAPSLCLRELGATRLDKGCYPGQEIVARMHYRGTGKQHVRHVQSASPLASGTTLRSIDGNHVGHLLDAVQQADGQHVALAVIRDTLPEDEVQLQLGEANGTVMTTRQANPADASGSTA